MNKVTIKLFRAYSEEGERLITLLKDSIQHFLQDDLSIDLSFEVCESKGLSIDEGNSPYQVLSSALNNDIVIIDGSIEEVNGYSLGVNYECVTPALMSLDNVLIVSRTQIPLNFLPLRSNVKKLGVIEDKVNPQNTSKRGYQLHYSNEQILQWLKKELSKMHKTGRLVRNPSLAIDISIPSQELLSKQRDIFEENTNFVKRQSTKNGYKKCFISYRGAYHTRRKYNGLYDVEKVKDEILRYHNGKADVQYFAEGVLSNELMPEVRRWAFVSYIDRVIRECDEFWIFNTEYKEGNNKEILELGYWDSWWCLAEILTILRLKKSLVIKPDFKVMSFNPSMSEGEQINEVDISKWHDITEEEGRELARYYANSDFLEAGYDSVSNMQKMRRWPKMLRKAKFYLMKKLILPVFANVFDEDGNMSSYPFSYFEDSVFSHVYDESFYTGRIITCSKCIKKGATEEIVVSNNFVWNFLNINGWYTNRKRIPKHDGTIVIEEEKFNQLANSEEKEFTIHCDQGHAINISRTDDIFYIWWTPRNGKRTGPIVDGEKSIIETVKLYSA